jgi:phosphohistidine phosphatase SixA
MNTSRRRLLMRGAGALVACSATVRAAPHEAAAVAPVPPLSSDDRSDAKAVDSQSALAARLKAGGVVIAFRHALAPGTFDPPGFKLDDCRTQRNLNDEGRAQAVRIGQWFREHRLTPAQVRSSPWCRCLDTAGLAFGAESVVSWPALGSPRGTSEQAYPDYQERLRKAAAQRRVTGGFEVWVTHMFVIQDLVGQGIGSAEALLLRGDPRASERRSAMAVLGHWRLPPI